MSNPLTEDYLRWLIPQIRDVEQSPTYWDLFRTMFEKEFEWFVPNDDNRLQDGLELREEYCHDNHIRYGSLNYLGPACFLEVLIGLSRRMEFAAGGSARGWAWHFVENLELSRMTDPLTRRKQRKVDEILDTAIHRTYTPDGVGGFFPLAWPDEDQTQKEIWYQMAAYINELNPDH
jgi:hypothetical protein